MKSKQIKLIIILVLFTLMLIPGMAPVFAKEQAIPSITIDVLLEKDGSAVITEVWEVRGISGGTEYYKALYNMDGISVHSLRVWDESGTEYKPLSGWDTDRSLKEKAGTSGILETAKGYELCWGIGSYGDHTYTLQYTLEGLVKDYGDYAGFYHQIVSELSSAPEFASVKISMADTVLTADNARIWGYGYTGEVDIGKDGSLEAFTSEPMDSGDYVNLLCRFDRSLFPLAAKADSSFEKLKEAAESDNSNTAGYIILGVLGAASVAAVILAAFFYSRYKLADGTIVRLPKRKQIDSIGTVPLGRDISNVYAAMNLLRRGISFEHLMSAYLIRWQEAGFISIEEREVKRGFHKAKKEEAIVLNPNKAPKQRVECSLYDILINGADEDCILWASDVQAQAAEFYEKLKKWAEEVTGEGQKGLLNTGAAARDKKGAVRFTAHGFEQAVRLLGFQKYLAEMHRPNGNEAPRELWGDYLVFATLFGSGEQVLKSMQALDPAYFDTFAGMYGCNAYSMLYFMNMTNHFSSAAAPNADGTGGAASASGGGGFSGGGGGGSR